MTKPMLREKMINITVRLTVLFLAMVLLSSCSLGTVKPFLKDGEFQAENLPVRTLRTLVLTDGTHDQSKIAKLIDQSSQLAEEQVGIRLKIIDWKNIDWKSKRSTVKMLKTVANETSSDKDQFDIAVAFTGLSVVGDGVLGLFGGTWLGVIDDTYRRFIIVKLLDPYVLLHELFHAFIFSEAHSMICIMTTGFYPIGKNCLWLGKNDRTEVLRNKDRDFNRKPNVEGGTDFIEKPEDRLPFEGVISER